MIGSLLWALNQLSPVFILIGLGYLAGRRLRVSRTTLKDLSGLLIYVLVPALIFRSAISRDFTFSWWPVLAAVLVITSSTIMAVGLTRRLHLPDPTRRSFMLSSQFMNAGSLGTSVAYLIYGNQGFLLAVVYYFTVQCLLFTLGPIELGGGLKNLRQGVASALRLPLIWALIAGMALNTAGVSYDGTTMLPLDYLARTTIPLLLLTLGLQLSRVHLTPAVDANRLSVPALMVSRMGTGIATAALFIFIFGLGGILAGVIVISSTMPSAITTYVVGVRFGGDTAFLSLGILWTTLITLVTLPLMLALL